MKKNSKNPRLFGIFGNPLAHTLSPAMQEAAFRQIGWKAHCLVFELGPRDFRKAMARLPRFPVEGFNLTVPYKQAVIPYLAALTPEARAVGAVNTVFQKGGRWIGANTDVYGFLTSLQKEGKFKPRGKKILVLGAGGASRAVIYGLASRGARKIRIAARRKGRAAMIARDFRKVFPKIDFEILEGPFEKLKPAFGDSDLVVNATSVGLKKKGPVLVPEKVIPGAGKKILFFDLIYDPFPTLFLKAAAKKGHRILGGLGMLLFQGGKAFEYWSGKKAPVEKMRQALEDGLKERHSRSNDIIF
ncbi:MAG: shikimate dehydrogenase [Omnitrophica bacterium GWA2_52_8]|nr:MAG: shikimate dehydrogenase [Omnitrophica bacterium GWA2_52_8]